MSHVFLSYSRRNSEAAFRIYDHLQSMGVPVWIDQRSIRPGASYAEEIYLAINNASAVVLLLTEASNDSREIHREIQLAANANVPVIPLRIESVTYHPALGYFLAALQWIDATSNEDRALSMLLDQLRRLQPASHTNSTTPSAIAEPPEAAQPVVPPQPVVRDRNPIVQAPTTSRPVAVAPVNAAGSPSSRQQRLAAGVLARFPDGVIRKIDQDNVLDIFIPSVCPRPSSNLTFKTPRGGIQVLFYCRSSEWVEQVLRSAKTFERWHWGLMLSGNPTFTDPEDAIRRATDMLDDIAEAARETQSSTLAEKSTTESRGLTRKDQLAAAITSAFPDAVVKGTNIGQWFYVHLPSVHRQWMTHLCINTSKEHIRFNFYCRDAEFLATAVTGGNELEATGSTVRLTGNPGFSTVSEAVAAAINFVTLLERRCRQTVS